jgi:hypothetical protein
VPRRSSPHPLCGVPKGRGKQALDSCCMVDCWSVLAGAGFVIPPWAAGLQVRRQQGEGGVSPALTRLGWCPYHSGALMGSALLGGRLMLLGQPWNPGPQGSGAGPGPPDWKSGGSEKQQQTRCPRRLSTWKRHDFFTSSSYWRWIIRLGLRRRVYSCVTHRA